MHPQGALLFFAVWTLILVNGVVGYRFAQVLLGKAAANAFPAGKPHDGPDIYHRFNRAHQNAVENLVVFGALVALVTWNGLLSDPTISTACAVVVVARIAQSCMHVISGGPVIVTIRAVFYTFQIIAFFVIAVRLASTVAWWV